jgi:hypothetical protein
MEVIQSNNPILALVLFLVVFGVVAWFMVTNVYNSTSVYSIDLNEGGSVNNLSGAFSVPTSISLSDGNYTFFINLSIFKGGGSTTWYTLEFNGPSATQCKVYFSIDPTDSVQKTIISNCFFSALQGDYSFKLSPNSGYIPTRKILASIDIRRVN